MEVITKSPANSTSDEINTKPLAEWILGCKLKNKDFTILELECQSSARRKVDSLTEWCKFLEKQNKTHNQLETMKNGKPE